MQNYTKLNYTCYETLGGEKNPKYHLNEITKMSTYLKTNMTDKLGLRVFSPDISYENLLILNDIEWIQFQPNKYSNLGFDN